MSANLLSFYHGLPAPLRTLAATLHGSRLRSWRYGPETEQLVQEAFQRESWSASQWAVWQKERLKFILHRAATKVPYYRKYWERRRAQGDRRSWDLLENWPILSKEPLREDPRAFVADDCDCDQMFHEETSGTTGKAVDLWFSRSTVRRHYALVEARSRRWYGVSRHDRWAILGGKLVVAPTQRHPPFWVWNGSMNQLYMSSYHLAPDLLPDYWQALRRHKVKYLWGYSSALFSLAQGALHLGLDGLKLHVVITNSEPVLNFQKETISKAFGCPVRETYGMCELAAAAGECESGQLHVWPDAGVIELFDGDRPATPGDPGELICTGLLNSDMPLIRYRVGDCAVLADPRTSCACGRTLPRFERIEGRLCDIILTADKRRIGRLDSVFLPRLPVQEAQIEQVAVDSFRVRCVPARGFDARTEHVIKERLRERLGNVEVRVEQVDAIPRGANGKFRALICSLPVDEKKRSGGKAQHSAADYVWNGLCSTEPAALGQPGS